MAKFNDKLEHRSAKEKFPSQSKLSAHYSNLQHPVEAAKKPCDTVVHTIATLYTATQHRTPLTETDPAFMHAQHLWRFRLALALYTGAFPNSMRRKPCSTKYVSYQTLLKQIRQRTQKQRKP